MKNNHIMGDHLLPTKSSNEMKDNSTILGFTCLDYVAPYLTQDCTSCTGFVSIETISLFGGKHHILEMRVKEVTESLYTPCPLLMCSFSRSCGQGFLSNFLKPTFLWFFTFKAHKRKERRLFTRSAMAKRVFEPFASQMIHGDDVCYSCWLEICVK